MRFLQNEDQVYGDNFAAVPHRITDLNRTLGRIWVNGTRSGGEIPAFTLLLVDQYDQTVISDNSS